MKWERILKIIGPVLFLYFLTRIDFNQLFSLVKNTNIFYLLLSFFLWSPLIFIRSLKWKVIVDSFGEKIAFRKLFSMFVKGIFWGLVTPARLGEFYRVKYLQEESKHSLRRSLFMVILDRMVDLFGAILLSLILFFILIYSMEIEIPIILGAILVLAFFVFLFIIFCQRQSRRIIAFFFKIILPSSFRIRVEDILDEFFFELKKIKAFFFLKLFGFELLCYLSMACAHFFLAKALGLSIPFWYLYLIDAFVVMAVSLPVSIFGLGTREASYAFLLMPFGVNFNEALAFSFIVMFMNFFIGIPGLILYLFEKRKGKSLTQ